MVTKAPPERVVALGPSAVAGVVSRSGGTLRMTVIAKATFAFALNAEMSRTEPQPIVNTEVHYADNPMRTVRFSSDRVPYLGQGEAFFTGHAHALALDGGSIASALARFAVFDETRALIDRTLKITKAGGFKKIALVYENAFGGVGCQDNPLPHRAEVGLERVLVEVDRRGLAH